MAEKIFKWILILLGIGFLIFVVYILMIVSALGGFDKDYSVSELKENFNKNRKEIYELKRYFNKIVPNNRFVEIEFEDDNTLFRFGIEPLDSTTGNPNGLMFLEWDLKTNNLRMEKIIKPLGWTSETLKVLKYKLDKANCIQIESGEPTKIGFKRSGLGLYSFRVFENPMNDSLRKFYSNDCTFIIANDKLVLEFGGGAIGSQCFQN